MHYEFFLGIFWQYASDAGYPVFIHVTCLFLVSERAQMFFVDSFLYELFLRVQDIFLQNHPSRQFKSSVQWSTPKLRRLVENFLAKGTVIVNDSA